MTSVILASGSPSRRSILRAAGIEPSIIVPGLDEDAAVQAAQQKAGRELSVAEQTLALAAAKGRAVIDTLRTESVPGEQALLIASDSMLEFDGRAIGKPHTPERARTLWKAMSGKSAYLHSGIFAALIRGGGVPGSNGKSVGADVEMIGAAEDIGSTRITLAALSDAEIDAYVGTGEPLEVAGGLTIDGYGAAFVTHIDGDHTNVLGMSVPKLRGLASQLGIAWHTLWNRASGANV